MAAFEEKACRESDLVIAVSDKDAETMAQWYGVPNDKLRTVATGVDVDFFRQPADAESFAFDLVFIGSMDWTPNEDAMRYFLAEVLPIVRRSHPDCSVAVVGRTPSDAFRREAEAHSGVTVTGTVPDVRPYLWGSRASIVPIRIGGGTRLKIYEAIAAGAPVVSTTIGAEGLDLRPDEHILIGDDAKSFAEAVLRVLDSDELHASIRETALREVESKYAWPIVAEEFESHLVEGAERRQKTLR